MHFFFITRNFRKDQDIFCPLWMKGKKTWFSHQILQSDNFCNDKERKQYFPEP